MDPVAPYPTRPPAIAPNWGDTPQPPGKEGSRPPCTHPLPLHGTPAPLRMTARLTGLATPNRSAQKRSWVLEAAAVLLPVALFVAIAAYHITLPGLYYDEAADAVPAMYLLQGRQPELVRPHGILLFGRTWPLMAFDYVGAVHTYAAIPFFALLGPGVVALRLMTIAGAAATVALTYGWVRWLFHNRWVGLAAALLLATHPSFVFYARQGVHVSSLMALWLMAALVLLLTWRHTGRARWLAGAAFMVGVGLSTKILFLWVLTALVAIYALWRAPGVWRALRAGTLLRGVPSRVPQTVAVVAAFLVGAAPIIVYNLQTGATLEAVTKSAEVTSYGVHNSDYLANFAARLDTLVALLRGDHFWFLGGLFGNLLFPWAVLAALLASGWLAWRQPPLRVPVAFVAGLTGLILVQSPFTVSGIWPTHLFILLPLIATLLAVPLVWLLRQRRAVAVASGVAVVVLAGLSVVADAQYHQALVLTGGVRGHSDAVYRLASYLDEHGVPAPLAMDWGIRYNVELVTQGRVRPQEVFGYTPEPDPGFATRLPLDTPEQRYIFHGEDYTAFNRLGAFEDAVRQAGKTARLEETFYERSGTPIYLLYSVS